VFPEALTVPATGVDPLSTRNEEAVIVEPSIGRVKVTVMLPMAEKLPVPEPGTV
jgi:hypothetical protein